MISDLDIWRSANALIKQHGDDAALIAAQRADELLATGNIEGQRVFKKIVKAINALQRDKPGEDERMNQNYSKTGQLFTHKPHLCLIPIRREL